MIDLNSLSITKAHTALLQGEYTVRELVEAYLDVIKKTDGDIHAYLEVFDDVVEQADRAQKMLGPENPLAGIPFAIKDNILIKGHRASASSKILENYVAPYDATAITKIKEKGAVFIGRVNMDEFAMGGSTEKSAYGVTKNPHDLERVSGGSSGGSAAAIAMNGALVALGSDTGGSVRQPASFCGVVGLKPTYGSISRHGLMAMGSSLDVIGPITKNVADAEIVWNAIRGKDSYDATSIDIPSNHSSSSKLRIGIPRHFLTGDGIDKRVMEVFEESVSKLKAQGHEIVDITLSNIEYSLPVYYVIMPAEVSTNLSRFDGVRYGLHKNSGTLLLDYMNSRGEGFGKEVRRRIMLGTYVLSAGYYDAYYNRALQVRDMLKAQFDTVFKSVDVILTPTAPTPAFKIGEKNADPVSMYLEDIFTVTANLVGVPAISVPAGYNEVDGKKLPIGIQFMADRGREDFLFTIGKDFCGEV
jgi:aspartyl-tRNA(Asn)/glutamyl-tRNA(Gln) amidotransferase subunit A